MNKLRYALRTKYSQKRFKVGHAGTLDPLATGLLLICTGKKTKEINNFMGLDKTYTGMMTLGGRTPSFDLETEIIPDLEFNRIEVQRIDQVVGSFIGEQDQLPPVFSAKRIDGKKAYESARKGQAIEMKVHRVNIKRFNIKEPIPSKVLDGGQDVPFEVEVSKGTYIRSLANDLGERLGCGSFLSALRRTEVGGFAVDDAMSVEEAVNWIESCEVSID